MIPKIKICGLTRPQDAQLALELGAQYLGFIFAKGTPREVNAQLVQETLQTLPKRVGKNGVGYSIVGVFLHESPETIQQLVEECALEFVQIHGPVSPAHRNQISVPIIPAIRMKNEDSTLEAESHLPHGPVLLDTYAPDQHGGTGKTFRHELAFPIIPKGQVFIAGGLNGENIAEVYSAFHATGNLPYAFDLSSGVEAEPRIKSEEKMRAFFLAYNLATQP